MIEFNGEIAQQQLEDEIDYAYQELDEEDYLLADDQDQSERIFSKLITNNNMKSNQVCWTTKDGRTIPVDDLSESHAKNILKMLIRNQNKIKTSANHLNNP